MSIAGYAGWLAYDMFLIVSLSGQPVYDPNWLRPNPNPKKTCVGFVLCLQVGSNIDTPKRSWTVMPTVVLQDKKSRLAIQLAHGLNLRLSQVARPSRQPALFWKTDFSHSILTQV